MEPVSILSAAAAISAVAGKAWELGSFVRELCQGAKTVDGRVRCLESAVTELARACEYVQGQFERMSPSSISETPALAWDEQGALTASIESQVKDCRRTLREPRKLLTDLRPNSSSFFGRTSRHIKLQDRTQQINDFSVRIKTHTDALQMSLQIVTIKIALATPDFLLQRLGAALEDLRVRLSRIESNTSPATSQMAFGEARGSPLLQHAREALRKGTTLYETSTAGSIAGAEPTTGSERAARIREWANKVDALRENHNDVSGVNLPSAVSAYVSPEKGTYTDAVEKPPDTSPVAVSADLCPVDQRASCSETIGVLQAEAAQDIFLDCNEERLPTSEQPKGIAPMKEHLVILGGARSINANTAGLGIASPSPHPSDRSSSTDCTPLSLSHESTTTTPRLGETTENSKALDQDTTSPAKISPKVKHKAKLVPFQYPMDTSDPLDRTTRRKLVQNWGLKINGDLEALLCTGEKVKPALLSKLLHSDQAAPTVPSSATSSEPKQGKSGLGLLLAVLFRDVYLVKPLIKLGFSPKARIKQSDDGLRYIGPIESAIATRCQPVIRVLLENGAELPYTCTQSPCFALLNHHNLRLFPPSGVESFTQVIDLLVPASPSKPVRCVCARKSDNKFGTCHSWQTTLLRGARNMPAEWSRYRMPLVTHLLSSYFPGGVAYRLPNQTRSPLYYAVYLGSSSTVEFLLGNAYGTLLKAWLRADGSETALEIAIRKTRNLPNKSLDIVRMLLEKGAYSGARRTGYLENTALRRLAMQTKRADLEALVKTYSKPRGGDAARANAEVVWVSRR